MSEQLAIDFNDTGRSLLDKLNAYSDYLQSFGEASTGKNPGIVSRLLKNVSQYRGIEVDGLNFSDLTVLYYSIIADLEDKEIKERSILEWRRGKNLGDFTFNQFCFLKEYVERCLNYEINKQFI